MWKVSNTWKKAATPTNQQRGFPAPGSGQQTTGKARLTPEEAMNAALIAYSGEDTYDNPDTPVNAQRGFPAPESRSQAYRPGQVTRPTPNGVTTYRETRNFSRGAQAFAPTTPIVLNTPNPGQIVLHRPNVLSKVPLGQYINNTIFWSNQIIPTTVKLSGLQTEKAVEALLSDFEVYGRAETL